METKRAKFPYNKALIAMWIIFLAAVVFFASRAEVAEPDAELWRKETTTPASAVTVPITAAAAAPVSPTVPAPTEPITEAVTTAVPAESVSSVAPTEPVPTEPAPTVPEPTEPKHVPVNRVIYGMHPEDTPLERVKRLIGEHVPPQPGNFKVYVFTDRHMVAVYRQDNAGNYSIPEQYFPCSAGSRYHMTPEGSYRAGYKAAVGYMVGDVFSQYNTQIIDNILFHSVPSLTTFEADVPAETFNYLGRRNDSAGCVRLSARDAKWIYDYIPTGTPIEVRWTSDGFDDLPEAIDIIYVKPGGPRWDPTNPNPENPYQRNPALLVPDIVPLQ